MNDFNGFMDGDQMLMRYSFDRPKVETPEEKPVRPIHTEGFKNLGYVNGWTSTPTEVKACREAGHKLITEHPHRGVQKFICEECRQYHEVDSTD